MRSLRRILVPIAWAALLTWVVGPLLPEAGLRMHAHPEGDAAHVHLDDLIAEAIGHRRHHHHASAHRHPHEQIGESHDHAHQESQREPSADTSTTPRAGAALRLPSTVHAHAANPFLLLVLAALALLLLVTRALPAREPAPIAPRDRRRALARARSPPVFSPRPSEVH